MRHALLAAATLLAPPLAAQRTWLDPLPGNSIGLVTTAAVFDDNITESPAFTGAIRVRSALANDLTLTLELPFARASQQGGLSGSAVGNPWFGIEHNTQSGMQLEIGVRVSVWSPTTQSRSMAFGYGQLLDFDRREAWFVRTSSLRAGAQVGRIPARGAFATVRFGLLGLVVGGGGGDGELLIHYGARAGFANEHLLGWVGVIGQGILTESGSDVGDRTVHQAEAGVTTRGSRYRLEASLRRFVAESFAATIPVTLRVGFTAGR